MANKDYHSALVVPGPTPDAPLATLIGLKASRGPATVSVTVGKSCAVLSASNAKGLIESLCEAVAHLGEDAEFLMVPQGVFDVPSPKAKAK